MSVVPLAFYSIVSSLLFRHTFEVKAKFDPSNLAFTSDRLALHIDLPYYDYVPGVSEFVNFVNVFISMVNFFPGLIGLK